MTKPSFQSVALVALTARSLLDTESKSSSPVPREKTFSVAEVSDKTFTVNCDVTIHMEELVELSMNWRAKYTSDTALTEEEVEAALADNKELLYPVWAQASLMTALLTEKILNVPIITNPLGGEIQGKGKTNAVSKGRKSPSPKK